MYLNILVNSSLNFNIMCCGDNGLRQRSVDGNDDNGDSTPFGACQISSHIPLPGSLRRILTIETHETFVRYIQ